MTHVQSGPTCTQILAWFGADVIKIERPGEGDPTRGQLRDIPGVDSLYFTMLNANKRSITLNPKTEAGKKIFTRLIEECDVMVENFAPGAIDRMGFPWETIQKLNPRMIYASVKGFGPGPFEDCKVYENVAQCTGGAASTTGEIDGVADGDRRSDRRFRHGHSSGGGHPGGAPSPGEDGEGPARGVRDAGCGAQSLSREAPRPAAARPWSAQGVSAVSERKVRRRRPASRQFLRRRPPRMDREVQGLGDRSGFLHLRDHPGGVVSPAGQGHRTRGLALRSGMEHARGAAPQAGPGVRGNREMDDDHGQEGGHERPQSARRCPAARFFP